MQKVTLWDGDLIESHNIPNQAFADSMVGESKSEAMRGIVMDYTGADYKTNGHWKEEPLEGVVMSCVDSMKVRKELLESMGKGLFIETRMGVYHGQVFTIDASNKEDVKFWMDNWVGDDIVEEKSACGTSLTIGSTAQLLSSIASWQFIKHMRGEKLARCITASVNPYVIMEQ